MFAHLLNKSENVLLFNQIENDINELEENTTDAPNFQACDSIACLNNISVCQLKQCIGIKRIRKIHYVITCVIVGGVILLMLATMYACRQQTKRSTQWQASHHRCNDHLMAIRIFQTVNRNIEMRNIQNISLNNIREAVPLQIHNESPPPYESQYTPPPDYQEATSYHFTQLPK